MCVGMDVVESPNKGHWGVLAGDCKTVLGRESVMFLGGSFVGRFHCVCASCMCVCMHNVRACVRACVCLFACMRVRVCTCVFQ